MTLTKFSYERGLSFLIVSEFREKVNDAIQCQFIFLDRVLTEICNTKLYKAKLHVFQFI